MTSHTRPLAATVTVTLRMNNAAPAVVGSTVNGKTDRKAFKTGTGTSYTSKAVALLIVLAVPAQCPERTPGCSTHRQCPGTYYQQYKYIYFLITLNYNPKDLIKDYYRATRLYMLV